MRVAHTAPLTEEEEYLVQGAGATGRWPAKSTQQDKQTNRHDLSPCGPSPTPRRRFFLSDLTCTEFLVGRTRSLTFLEANTRLLYRSQRKNPSRHCLPFRYTTMSQKIDFSSKIVWKSFYLKLKMLYQDSKSSRI